MQEMVESSRTFIQSLWAGAELSPQKVLSAQDCLAGEHQEEMHEVILCFIGCIVNEDVPLKKCHIDHLEFVCVRST